VRNRRFAILSSILVLMLIVTTAGVFVYHEREEYAQYHFDKRHSDPDAIFGGGEEAENENLKARIGNGNERGPQSAEEEDYRNRAYPATEIPFVATVNAQNAFKAVKARKAAKNAPGAWTLYGPSSATVPAALSFYGGANKEYVTAGRITALAIDPACSNTRCRLWVAAAGGGVWRTDNALSGSGASWTFVSGSFATNAIGTLTYDAAHGTLYAGTGEPNASGDSEAGMGIYKSTNGGTSWIKLEAQTTFSIPTGPVTMGAFDARSISSIVVDPTNANVLYVGSTRGVRGVSSVTGGAVSQPAVAAPWGVYKSTNGGASFTFLWDGGSNATICDTVVKENTVAACSIRGANHVELDPSNAAIVYAAAFQVGVWRSTNGGATWAQIKAPLNPTFNTDRAEFAVTKLPDGKTRMYVGIGAGAGATAARLYRTDDAAGAASFADITSPGSLDYCTGQCWYDNFVYTPAGYPDTVYLGGSHQYGEIYGSSNGRGTVMSTNAGVSFTDMTVEYGDGVSSINLHPDHHALVTMPSNPNIFFSGTDGGLVRSNGKFVDNSAACAARGLSGASLAMCQGLLSKIPERLFSLNKGFSTLQFQSLLVDSFDYRNVIAGTQDNGTWVNSGSSQNWSQTIYGDGGQSGFSTGNPALTFNTFTGQATDVNFQNGDPTKWVIATGPIVSSPEGAAFYPPVISDPHPTNAKTIFQGSQSVWRTQDWGGDQAYLEANCPEFTTSAANPACGDFVRIGPASNTDLTGGGYGTDRGGNVLAAIERTPSDTGTLWAATATGRVFISKNSDAAAGAVTFTRLDSLAANDPGRFVSSIFVDAANSNHAWISYSGYNINTPAQPGHVFSVTYDPSAGTATWVNLDAGTGPMGDLPVTDLVQDSVTGDLYAATDFGVLRLANGSTTWTVAGAGLPYVEVPGLTIVPGTRILYAATHGRSAWKLTLP
jgi:hypothetical protein